jgi:hypothetical protein
MTQTKVQVVPQEIIGDDGPEVVGLVEGEVDVMLEGLVGLRELVRDRRI